MWLNLARIRYFLVLTESDSYIEAADKLFVSQSTLSKNIMILEKELQVKLFDRKGRKAVLTNAGVALRPRAEAVLYEFEKLIRQAKYISSLTDSIIRIGMLPISNQYKLTLKFKNLRISHPELSIEYTEQEDPNLIEGIRCGRFDMLIIREASLPSREFRTHFIYKDNVIAVLPISHPLADVDSIELGMLKNEKFTFMIEKSGPYNVCLSACKACGFQPQIIGTARTETIISSVAAEECVSLLFERYVNTFNFSGTRVIPLKCPITSNIVLAIPKARRISAAERIIADSLRIE